MKKENNKDGETVNKPEFQNSIYIKGLGTITSVGELNMEKWIKRLLKSKYITEGELKK